MSKLTEERIFKDCAREIHRVAPSLTIYSFEEVLINPWTKEKKVFPRIFVVGSKRYNNVRDANLDLLIALRSINRHAAILQKIVDFYGTQR